MHCSRVSVGINCLASGVIALLACCASAGAEASDVVVAEAVEVVSAPEEALEDAGPEAPPETGGNPADATPPPMAWPPEVATTIALIEIREEMAALREEMKGLQETLNLMVNRILADLDEENAALRRELRDFYSREGIDALPGGGFVPRPHGDVLEDLFEEAMSEVAVEEVVIPVAAAAPPAEEFGFSVLDEWGRAPEDAAALGPEVSTLKGMVCLVPPGGSLEQLEMVGRELHASHMSYDNVNIVAFDNKEAADLYVTERVTEKEHLVLTVSKHRDSGRNVILLHFGEDDIEIVP